MGQRFSGRAGADAAPRTVGIVVENYVAGGSDVIANQLASNLSDANVVIFTNAGNDERNLLARLDTERIRIIRYRWRTLAELGTAAVGLKKRGRRRAASILRYANFAIRYPHVFASALFWAYIFKSHGIELVVSNNGGYPGGEMCRAAVLGARLLGRPAVMIVHSMPTRSPAVLRPFEMMLDRLIARSATLVAVTGAIAEAFPSVRNLRVNKVIENAVRRPPDLPDKSQHDAVTDILSIGAIAPWKNQILAVNAYRRLVQRLSAERPDLPTPTLTIIGAVADENYHQTLLSVIQSGHVDRERIMLEGYGDVQAHLQRRGQLLLISSDVEGLPLVLLEAMSYGVPAVATRVGGIPSAIDDASGMLCEPGDVEGLAHSLWDCVTVPALYEEVRARNTALFEDRFTLEVWIARYESLFHQVLADARST